MCGRFTLTASPEQIERTFGLAAPPPPLEARFNVAPGQDVATIHSERGGGRILQMRRWGLVPYWAKDPRIGSRLINARTETLTAKPAFRDAARRRRCLVPADGFFEWADVAAGPRQPYLVARPDRRCFAIAGLYERWRDPAGAWLETCVLLTTDANARLARLHDRMPVILPEEHWARWLDPSLRDPAPLLALLGPRPDDELEAVAVSRRVNRPEHDDPDCIEPLRAGAPA